MAGGVNMSSVLWSNPLSLFELCVKGKEEETVLRIYEEWEVGLLYSLSVSLLSLTQSRTFPPKQSDSVWAGCEDGAHFALCAVVILWVHH